MIFNKLIIKNYKKFTYLEIPLNKDINIIVGNNECGKSTILEAINLVATGKLEGRPIEISLSTALFNHEEVLNYINSIQQGKPVAPPEIVIELYAEEIPENANYQGKNNLLVQDVPGISLSILFNHAKYADVYNKLIKNKEMLDLPIEFYQIEWKTFKGETLTFFNKLCTVSTIDTATNRYNALIGKFINDDILAILSEDDQKKLAMTYRVTKNKFADDEKIATINALLEEKTFIKNKEVSLALTDIGFNNWKKELSLSINHIPYPQLGTGTQNVIKINLALNKIKDKSNLILIEEPENHLSYSNMSQLINDIINYKEGKQIFIVTHSNYVANKIGIKNLILINEQHAMKFDSLSEETVNYFMKLPGFDTLRLILSSHPILVEGPSDELIVQKAYLNQYDKLPIEDGTDVISVKGLSFLRFCEIAESLQKPIRIITDNDGDIENHIEKKYIKYLTSQYVKIYYNKDNNQVTLEPSFVAVNDFDNLKTILKSNATSKEQLITIMSHNKTGWALKIFETTQTIHFPVYINECIQK